MQLCSPSGFSLGLAESGTSLRIKILPRDICLRVCCVPKMFFLHSVGLCSRHSRGREHTLWMPVVFHTPFPRTDLQSYDLCFPHLFLSWDVIALVAFSHLCMFLCHSTNIHFFLLKDVRPQFVLLCYQHMCEWSRAVVKVYMLQCFLLNFDAAREGGRKQYVACGCALLSDVVRLLVFVFVSGNDGLTFFSRFWTYSVAPKLTHVLTKNFK